MVQWLGLHTPNAGVLGSTPDQGTRSHTLQLRARRPQLKDVITKCSSSQNIVPRSLEVPETCTGVHKIKTIFKNYFHNNIKTLTTLFTMLIFAHMV